MNKIKGFITISAFSLLVLCLPAIASAQYGGNGGWNNGNNNGGYNNGNNNGGYNNGGYGNNGYSRDIRSTVRDLKERSKNFAKMIDRDRDNNNNGGYNNGGYNNGGYNNGGYNNGQYGNYGGYNNGGYNNNDQRKSLKKMADRFKDAADNLEDKYDNGRDMYKSSDEAQRVLNYGSQLEQSLNNYGSSSYLRSEWSQISRDLRIISDAYRYNNNGRGNGNGRGNNNGTWNNGNKPSWWPF